MNLAIDIGNTSTKFAVFNDSKILHYFRMPTSGKINPLGIFKNLPHEYNSQIKHIGISSVVPTENVMYRQACIKHFNIKPLFISAKITLPVNIRTDIPLKTGSDRICLAASGYEHYGKKKNIIVVGLGTANTFDVVLKNGDFIGGVIAPGLGLSAKALFELTEKLPLIENEGLKIPKRIVGKTPEDSVRSGLMYSALYSVEGIVKNIEKQYGRKFKVIITGGFAKRIKRHINFKAKFIEEMVLKSINEIVILNAA